MFREANGLVFRLWCVSKCGASNLDLSVGAPELRSVSATASGDLNNEVVENFHFSLAMSGPSYCLAEFLGELINCTMVPAYSSLAQTPVRVEELPPVADIEH